MIHASLSGYIMEDSREASRLSAKVDTDAFIQQYLRPYIHSETQAILDVGCGPAVITGRLAACHPGISCTGIDLSLSRVEHARLLNLSWSNVHILQADATMLPFEDQSFDLIYCRFLLEYLKEGMRAIEEMLRVCKRGGKVILQDLDVQLVSNYPTPYFDRDLQQVIDYLLTTGFDPFLGRKLYHMTYVSGLKVDEIKIEPYHQIFGKIDQHQFDLWKLKLDIALPQIIKALGSEQKGKTFKKQYLDYLLDERTCSFSNLITVNSTRQ